VPGDPTDTSIQLRPLEPATGQALARDLVLKTRRRKGLSDSIAVSKYLEDEVRASFATVQCLDAETFPVIDDHCHQCFRKRGSIGMRPKAGMESSAGLWWQTLCIYMHVYFARMSTS